MVTYGCAAWHKKVSQLTCIRTLTSLQRLACVIATRALSSTPTAALEAILGLTPLEIHIKMEASRAMLRAKESGRNKWQSVIMKSLDEELMTIPIMSMPSDVMDKVYGPKRLYNINLPDRKEWQDATPKIFTSGDIVWYTDGSRKGTRGGAGVHGVRPRLHKSFGLGAYATVFQAEMYAIIMCVHENLLRKYKNKKIVILSDSQAALKALNSDEIDSKLTMECVQVLNHLGTQNTVILGWVPGHSKIDGNEAADELARGGADKHLIGPEPLCGIPKSSTRRELKTRAIAQSIEAWGKAPGQKHAKALVQGYSKQFTKESVILTGNQIRILVRALTGHCRLNKHLNRMGLQETTDCRFCLEEEETPIHILCECEALIHIRNRVLGGHKVHPDEIKSLAPKLVLRFLGNVGLEDEL